MSYEQYAQLDNVHRIFFKMTKQQRW